jgi:methylase of polypeptide subunit release factors
MHSPYPTDSRNAVFLGPDTYRFAVAIRALFARHPNFQPKTVADVGTGTGAGGLLCGLLRPQAHILLMDINAEALGFAEVNSRINGVQTSTRTSSLMTDIEDEVDFVICNPPYLVDEQQRTYRNGGGDWGFDLALELLRQALPRLGPEGKLLVYTGTPVVEGLDLFREQAFVLLRSFGRSCRYEEIDPDVFGEELERGPYVKADRIGVVVLTIE